jgi:hypothetical protein
MELRGVQNEGGSDDRRWYCFGVGGSPIHFQDLRVVFGGHWYADSDLEWSHS